jgi:hypothetical protein
MFWSAEGAGAHWPAGDGALLVIIPLVLGASWGMGRVLRTSVMSGSGGDATGPERTAPA